MPRLKPPRFFKDINKIMWESEWTKYTFKIYFLISKEKRKNFVPRPALPLRVIPFFPLFYNTFF